VHADDRAAAFDGDAAGRPLLLEASQVVAQVGRLELAPGDRVFDVNAAEGQRDGADHGGGAGEGAQSRGAARRLEADQEGQGRGEVDHQQGEERPVHPEGGNPPEAHHQARGDASGGVDRRGDSNAPPHALGAARIESDQDGKCGAEERCGNQDDREHQQVEQMYGIAGRRDAREGGVGEGEERHGPGAHHDARADGDVQDGEGSGEIPDRVYPAGDRQTADADTEEVGREDGGEAVEGPLHDHAEDLRPDDLVADGDEARRGEAGEVEGSLGSGRNRAARGGGRLGPGDAIPACR
jgi:hypothetical protein